MEIAGNEESQDEALMELIDITSEYGSDPDIAWALTGYTEIRKMHSLRHAATESVIQFIERKHHEDKRIIRLGVKPLSRGRSFQETILSIHTGAGGCKFMRLHLCTHQEFRYSGKFPA